jgi:hypothetical protein
VTRIDEKAIRANAAISLRLPRIDRSVPDLPAVVAKSA